MCEDGVFIEIKKLGGNCRRIRSKIGIEASLDTVWDILTDYEKLADLIPGLAVSRVVEKNDKFARLFQVHHSSISTFDRVTMISLFFLKKYSESCSISKTICESVLSCMDVLATAVIGMIYWETGDNGR